MSGGHSGITSEMSPMPKVPTSPNSESLLVATSGSNGISKLLFAISNVERSGAKVLSDGASEIALRQPAADPITQPLMRAVERLTALTEMNWLPSTAVAVSTVLLILPNIAKGPASGGLGPIRINAGELGLVPGLSETPAFKVADPAIPVFWPAARSAGNNPPLCRSASGREPQAHAL